MLRGIVDESALWMLRDFMLRGTYESDVGVLAKVDTQSRNTDPTASWEHGLAGF